MKMVGLTTNTNNPKLGVERGTKYPILNSRVWRGTTFYSIVTTSGRYIDVTLGKGVIANFKPVYRV